MAPLILNGITENELVQQCMKQDRHAQKQLFQIYAPKMMAVCSRYARHRMEAEEIMQDGFVRVFTCLDQYSFKGSFEGWIRRIMINTALKLVAKKSFKNEVIGLPDYEDQGYAPSVISTMSMNEILALVEQLPLGYKTVFNMAVIDGLSHKEIGEILEIKESTSRSQLVKARNMLKNLIIEQNKIAI